VSSTYGGGGGYDPGTGPYPPAGDPYSGAQPPYPPAAGDPYSGAGSYPTGANPYDSTAGYPAASGAVGASAVGASATGATAGGSSATTTDRPDVENQSVGDLVGQLTSDVTTLMRQELALAKAEMREEAKKAGKAAGMLAAAGLAGHFVLLFLSLTLMWVLGYLFDSWAWSAFIVTIVWGIIGAVLFTMGRKQLKEVNPKPEQTVESLKEDKEWVKAQRS
jgi:uncharacterized membrane protein YqjE